MLGVSTGAPGRTTMVAAGSSRLFVREVGTGQPIVIVHGGPDFDHEYLAPELDGLAERFRVVYYDQRGRGRSFAGEAPGDVTIAGEVEDLDRVRAWTGADSIALLGHSWGGLLALEYAIRHSDHLSHLILLNTAPASHGDMVDMRHELRAQRSAKESARMAELRSDPAFMAGDIAAESEYYRIHFGSTVPPERLDELVRRLRISFTPEAVVAARAIEDVLYQDSWNQEDYDLIPNLRSLTVPTLVIRGGSDFIPAEGVRRIVDAIPGTRFVELPDAGHFTFLEQPERVRSLITEFLAAS